LAEFPTAVVRVRDWLRANASESSNSRQFANIGDVVADAALHLVQGTYYPPSVIHAQYVSEFGGYTGKMSTSAENTRTGALPSELENSLSNVSTSYTSSLTHQNHNEPSKDSSRGSELGERRQINVSYGPHWLYECRRGEPIYTRAFGRELGSKTITNTRSDRLLNKVRGIPVTCTPTLSNQQHSKLN
jgi:hypothetical protein